MKSSQREAQHNFRMATDPGYKPELSAYQKEGIKQERNRYKRKVDAKRAPTTIEFNKVFNKDAEKNNAERLLFNCL